MNLNRVPVLVLSAIIATSTSSFAGPLDTILDFEDARFSTDSSAKIELGQLLYYDPTLSGNRKVSCASCHHPRFGTSDGLSLGLGDGATGLGPERKIDPNNVPEERVARNAPALFNLGAVQFQHLFHDGRLEADSSRPSGIRTPLDDDMVVGFESALAAQAMFPVLSPDEMAGHYSENEIAQAVRQGFLTGDDGAWELISARVSAIPEYRSRFDEVIGTEKAIHLTDIANAIASFVAFEWLADGSPFDTYLLAGTPLKPMANAGMQLFYGKANCVSCHSGQFQTDHDFHAIAMPQIGPGKKGRFESHHRDDGRLRVTGQAEDAYQFRTPSLRNVTMTAPYGHDGAYATLEAVVRHHLDPVSSLESYDPSQAVLPDLPGHDDFSAVYDPQEVSAIAAANELPAIDLSDEEVSQLLAFLDALTDPISVTGRLGVPATVPSGLHVDQ